jgi:hypothetical protein
MEGSRHGRVSILSVVPEGFFIMGSRRNGAVSESIIQKIGYNIR